MLLRRLFLLCLASLFLAALSAETRHIHVIQLLDDNSPNFLIREGCRSIDYGVAREVDRIQTALGISDVHYYRLNGMSFSAEALDFVIDYQLSYQERDIVLFVYAGHGFRTLNSSNQLPKLYFTGYDTAREGDDIRMRLLERNPSVLLNIVVACNTTQQNYQVPPGQPQDSGPSQNRLAARPRSSRPYEVLFADQPGYTKVVDLVSSDREYETFMSRDGGIFFSEVIYAFEEIFADERFSNWPAICNYISNQTLQRTNNRKLPQKPYCAYSVFAAIAEAPLVTASRLTSSQPLSCRMASRALRKDQRMELKILRRRHRRESASTRSREERKMVNARHRQETSQMKYVHLQAYQRQSGSCK